MEVFRISKELHANQLTASGKQNRWNKDQQNVIYTGASRSLSTLELVVHKNSISPSRTYKVMVISIADIDHLYTQIKTTDLPKNWRKMVAYNTLQDLGSNWYENKTSLILKVPSAVIPYEFNYLINIEHPDFNKKNVNLVRVEEYFWDGRLM